MTDTFCAKCGAAWMPGYEHSVGNCRDWLYQQKSELKAALHALTGYEFQHGTEFWRLNLNRYQRDNLLWLLRDLLGHGAPGVEPFTFAHTGDWTGEIAFQLEAGPMERRPNASAEAMKERIGHWLKSGASPYIEVPDPEDTA